jgi:hypothetical protein
VLHKTYLKAITADKQPSDSIHKVFYELIGVELPIIVHNMGIDEEFFDS